jgi:hypothetical protein
MRRRKPWVRLRRRLLGWNVRLLTEELQDVEADDEVKRAEATVKTTRMTLGEPLRTATS